MWGARSDCLLGYQKVLDAEATARLKYNINELCVRSGPETPILTSIGITVPADTGMKRMNMMATALSID